MFKYKDLNLVSKYYIDLHLCVHWLEILNELHNLHSRATEEGFCLIIIGACGIKNKNIK